jgi:hypothetical protein
MRADLPEVPPCRFLSPMFGFGQNIVDDEDGLLLVPMTEELRLRVPI